jgi:hypothetical protein
MTHRSDFTAEQWQALRNAPQLVALATAAAGNSGLFGSITEGMAMASAMAETVRGEDSLLKELFTKDDIRAAQDDIRGLIKGAADKSALNTKLQDAAASSVTAALAALTAHGADATGYRRLLGGIAEKIANASSEGGFLGFGGERVSEGERLFLDRLKGLVA